MLGLVPLGRHKAQGERDLFGVRTVRCRPADPSALFPLLRSDDAAQAQRPGGHQRRLDPMVVVSAVLHPPTV